MDIIEVLVEGLEVGMEGRIMVVWERMLWEKWGISKGGDMYDVGLFIIGEIEEMRIGDLKWRNVLLCDDRELLGRDVVG